MAEIEEAKPGEPASPKPKRKAAPKKTKKTKARAARPKKKSMRKAPSEPAAARATKLAINLVDFEKTTFDSAAKLLTSLNDQSEKAVRHALANAPWLPREGQRLVEEWQRTLRHSLRDFTKTVDKSFDLMSRYLARVQDEASKKGKKA